MRHKSHLGEQDWPDPLDRRLASSHGQTLLHKCANVEVVGEA